MWKQLFPSSYRNRSGNQFVSKQLQMAYFNVVLINEKVFGKLKVNGRTIEYSIHLKKKIISERGINIEIWGQNLDIFTRTFNLRDIIAFQSIKWEIYLIYIPTIHQKFIIIDSNRSGKATISTR